MGNTIRLRRTDSKLVKMCSKFALVPNLRPRLSGVQPSPNQSFTQYSIAVLFRLSSPCQPPIMTTKPRARPRPSSPETKPSTLESDASIPTRHLPVCNLSSGGVLNQEQGFVAFGSALSGLSSHVSSTGCTSTTERATADWINMG